VYLAAIADALLLSDAWQDHLKQTLLAPIKELVAQKNSARQTHANSSKVDFFTVARESGAGQDDED
jgi:alpha-D-ribose 1-methylphosphonate 5-triphosphate synthase subunit PhnG